MIARLRHDPELRQPRQVETPFFARPQLPEGEVELHVAVRVADRPVVDFAEMQRCVGAAAVLVCAAEMLDVVTFGAERDQADEALAALRVIELPPLMTGDAILMTNSPTDLAAMVRGRIRTAAQLVPMAYTQGGAKVRAPRTRGKELHGQPRRAEGSRELFEDAVYSIRNAHLFGPSLPHLLMVRLRNRGSQVAHSGPLFTSLAKQPRNLLQRRGRPLIQLIDRRAPAGLVRGGIDADVAEILVDARLRRGIRRMAGKIA